MNQRKEVFAALQDFLSPLTSRKNAKNLELCFFTYSLDEFVLFDFLRTFEVPHANRIRVFTNLDKHYNRGVVAQQYKNVQITRVDVTDYSKRSCAVFHPKLIILVDDKKIRRVAIGSFNFRVYHLADSSHTVETFHWWEADLPKSNLPILKSSEANASEKVRVCNRDPETIVFELSETGSLKSLRCTNASVHEVVKSAIGGSAEQGILGGAPFIAKTTIKKLEELAGKPTFVWQKARRGKPLHAKFLQIGTHTFWGSFNLTVQAFLGRNKNENSFNTETVVIDPRKSEFEKIKSYLTQHLGAPLKEHAIGEDDEPGDADGEDDDIENWRERKDLHRAAPIEIVLICAAEKRIQIKSSPSWMSASTVAIGESGAQLRLRIKDQKEPLLLDEEEMSSLRRLLVGEKRSFKALRAPKVRGIKAGKVIWESYLSVGTISRLVVGSKSPNGGKLRGKRSQGDGDGFVDIRTIRDHVIIDGVDVGELALIQFLFGESSPVEWIKALKEHIDG